MILDCDFGNSSLKWRLHNEGCQPMRGVQAYEEGFDFLQPYAALITRVRAASVAGSDVDDKFIHAIQTMEMPAPEWLSSSAFAAGVSNGYDQPNQLGVDRWLAIVSAYNKYRQPLIVVDSGTALTLDVVDAQGVHLGGYILPGRHLMLQSLYGGTSSSDIADSDLPYSDVIATNTQQAVSGGVDLALLASIIELYTRFEKRLTGLGLVLSGGGVQRYKDELKKHLHAELIVEELDLVLDGIGLVMP